MATYSVLDNIKNAEALRDQIVLEMADLTASLEYEEATSTRYDPDDPDNPDSNYLIDPDPETYAFLRALTKLVEALNEYLKDRRP